MNSLKRSMMICQYIQNNILIISTHAVMAAGYTIVSYANVI